MDIKQSLEYRSEIYEYVDIGIKIMRLKMILYKWPQLLILIMKKNL